MPERTMPTCSRSRVPSSPSTVPTRRYAPSPAKPTLYRHFPTREALLEALLQATLAELTQKAGELETSDAPDEALVSWFRDGVTFVRSYSGVVDLMAAAIADPDSALHASCVSLRSAGTRLLLRAQAEGMARTDIDGIDLFALIGALGWVGDQPSFAPRTDHLLGIIAGAILTRGSTSAVLYNSA